MEGEFPCEMKPHPDFDKDHTIRDNVQAGHDTDVIRVNENEIRVLFANGGHLRLVSNTPIAAFIKPQE